ncbi:MAG: GGDEF domain-containing phosphodiesterase [Pseudomonadota bacterium]
MKRTFLRPQMVAFLPAIMLGGYWYGGQGVLMIIALTFPLILVLGGLFEAELPPVDSLTGLLTRDALREEIEDALLAARAEAEATVVIVMEIDGGSNLETRLGIPAMEAVLCRTADRAIGAVRGGDKIAKLGRYRYGILVGPARNAGMDMALRTVERIQNATADPISIDAASVYVTLSAGFCLERRALRRTGEALIEAAEAALAEARVPGNGAVRAYSREMRAHAEMRSSIAADFERALEEGEILPWFQPQVSMETGDVSGMEALARWQHPARGLIPPVDFLPAAEAGGHMERLGEVMVFHALSALRRWDREGMHIPKMGVNFSSAELRNPRLVERIKWELDRFDLDPSRLTVEVLETVVSETCNDTITSNISGLADLGCSIDLDDFGTGAASIANIRRFAVSRIKIDRSFITRLDEDPSQEKMVAAILSLAEKLDVDTVAEGVETVAELQVLNRLGCGHAQGYAFARPMPIDEAGTWLQSFSARRIQPSSAASA